MMAKKTGLPSRSEPPPPHSEWVYLWEFTDSRGRRQVTRRPLTEAIARELLKDPVMVFGSGQLRRSLLPKRPRGR